MKVVHLGGSIFKREIKIGFCSNVLAECSAIGALSAEDMLALADNSLEDSEECALVKVLTKAALALESTNKALPAFSVSFEVCDKYTDTIFEVNEDNVELHMHCKIVAEIHHEGELKLEHLFQALEQALS